MNPKLRTIVVINSINSLADNLLLPVYALFVQSVGGGPIAAGGLFALANVASMIGGIIAIRLQDSGAVVFCDRFYVYTGI